MSDKDAAIDHLEHLLTAVRRGSVDHFQWKVDYEAPEDAPDVPWADLMPDGPSHVRMSLTLTAEQNDVASDIACRCTTPGENGCSGVHHIAEETS